jgi:hypothetical protein
VKQRPTPAILCCLLFLSGGCTQLQETAPQARIPDSGPRLSSLPGCPFPTIEILNPDSLLLCGKPVSPGTLIRSMRAMRTPPHLYVLVSPRTAFGDLVVVVYRFYEAGLRDLSLTPPPTSI